jgi:hypothetical protein
VYQALEQRSQLHAGEFEYKVTITKSGEERPSSVQRGLYSYDDRIGNTLHVYLKTSLENEDSRDTLSTIAGGVYNAPPGDTVYITSDLENTFTPSDPLNRRKNQLKPFEFRRFGFANASDISQNADFEKLSRYTDLIRHNAAESASSGRLRSHRASLSVFAGAL